MKPSFAIIGCGKVGTALAEHLVKAGYPPAGFGGRNTASARLAAEIAGAPSRWYEKMWDATKAADIVFITTPDDTIAEVCALISENKGFSERAMVFHCSGALASTILVSAKTGIPENGKANHVQNGSLHPLQSFAAVQTKTAKNDDNPFGNIIMAVEGDAGAVSMGREIAADLGARPFTIRTDGKILYHAAAVVASNYLVTLMNLAIQLMSASGVSETDAFEILSPLIRGTLANIRNAGIPDALTGPISRGDARIVEKHIQAIGALPDERASEMADYYIRNGRETIKIARAKGTLSQEAADFLFRIFKT
jgi:predicted short-subunit dehydrogenase-like oxidoreductase (DUF2520 family)